ncbi:GroES-like protein [Trichoderma sp. SZMC 28013]
MAPAIISNGDFTEISATTELKDIAATALNGGSIIHTSRPNPSLQATADHKLKMVEAPVLEPKRGEVLLHIKATGICGSDVHFWKSGRIGSLVFEGDCILGHEAAGVVLKCGEGVTNLVPGDRVAIEPGVPCGECFLCLEGKYNLCEDVKFSGVYPYAGTIQRYKIHPAKWLHKLPTNISFAEGALLEPLSVVLHGIRTAGLNLGCGTVICGAGPIGLIALAAARASGAHPIVITDIEPKRLEFAREFIPSCRTYQVDPSLSAEENGRRIRRLFRHADADISQDIVQDLQQEYYAPRTILECTGVESSVCTAAFTVRRGGTICVIGVGKSIMNNLPFMHISLAEIELKFINRYRDTWPAGIACLSGGILDLKPLVTHVYPLEDAMDALHLAADPRNGSIKIQIVDEASENAIE